jgi:hypothetical protein
MFCWIILNPYAEALDAVLQRRMVFVCSMVAAYAIFAFAFWGYFRYRPFGQPERS